MAIKITLPTIEAGTNLNTFTLNRKKARVRNLPADWRCDFKLTYPDMGIDIGFWNTETELNINEFTTNEFVLQNNLWHPNNIITLYFCNNIQETAAAVSYEIIAIDMTTELELYRYKIPYLSSDNSLEFNIYPIEESNQTKIKIDTIPETNVASYFQIKVQQQHYNTIEWSTNDYDIIKEEDLYNSDFATINNTGQAKITIDAILYNKDGKAVNTEQEILDENEASMSSNTYLTYIAPLDHTPGVGIVSSVLSINDQKPVKQQPVFEVLNKSQITMDWSNIIPTSNFKQPYWYLLRPKNSQQKEKELENLNLKINAHLQGRYLYDPIEKYNYDKYGKLITKTPLNGYLIGNYNYDNDIAYGLPLPSKVFNKTNTNIQKWSGIIAGYFGVGKGTETDPYIISTPEELARAILKDGETRYEAWKKRKDYDYFEDKEEWRDEYFNSISGDWLTDLTRIYYEVSSNCYAFDMGGLEDITLQTTRAEMLNKGWSRARFQNQWSIKDSAPAYGFSGSLKGNGLIIYNLNGWVSGNQAAGFIPLATGTIELQDIIIKNSHFSNASNVIEYSVGGFIGAHNNFQSSVIKRSISINNCMIINSQIIYRGHSAYGVAAAFVGNARYVPTIIINCCSYFNSIDTSLISKTSACSIGGFIGCFQGGSDDPSVQPNAPICKKCGMVGSSLVPEGRLYLSPIAHWGYKKRIDTMTGREYLCTDLGEPLRPDGNENIPPIQLNKKSKSYHFFSGINAYYNAIISENWTDTDLDYTKLLWPNFPYPSSTKWWEENWSYELWAQFQERERWMWDQIHEGWSELREYINSEEGFASWFYEYRTANITTANGETQTLTYIYWKENYYKLYWGDDKKRYHYRFITNGSGESTTYIGHHAFDIDNDQFEHVLNSPTSSDTKADLVLRNVRNFRQRYENFDGSPGWSNIPFYLTRIDQKELQQKYNEIYQRVGKHWDEDLLNDSDEPYTNQTEEDTGILLPDGTIKIPNCKEVWTAPSNILYRKVYIPYQIKYTIVGDFAYEGYDTQYNSTFYYDQQETIFNINDLLNKNIPYLYSNKDYYKPKSLSSNLKVEEQKFVFDLCTTKYVPRGNDVSYWLETEVYYPDPDDSTLPYYGRNTRIDNLGNEIIIKAHSPIVEVIPNPTVYVKSPYYGNYVSKKIYGKQTDGSYKEGRVFIRQQWDSTAQKYIYKEAF